MRIRNVSTSEALALRVRRKRFRSIEESNRNQVASTATEDTGTLIALRSHAYPYMSACICSAPFKIDGFPIAEWLQLCASSRALCPFHRSPIASLCPRSSNRIFSTASLPSRRRQRRHICGSHYRVRANCLQPGRASARMRNDDVRRAAATANRYAFSGWLRKASESRKLTRRMGQTFIREINIFASCEWGASKSMISILERQTECLSNVGAPRTQRRRALPQS